MRDYQKYAAIVAAFATVLYFALIVAAFGLISLATNLEVVNEPDAGPLVGPSMVGAAVLLVFIVMVTHGVKAPPERQRVAVGFAVATGIAALGVFIAVGALLYWIGDGQPLHAITFAESTLLGPFALATGVLAFIVALCYSLILASRVGEHGRPLWPWERRNE